MAQSLFIDIETASPLPIGSVGAYRYLEEAEIIMAAWAVDSGPVRLWDIRNTPEPPDELLRLLQHEDTTLIAHNATFERVAFLACWGLNIPPERFRCTQILARAAGLPSSLGQVATMLGSHKIEEGKDLIKLFCSAGAEEYRLQAAKFPEKAERFGQYCRQDVAACRHVWNVLVDIVPQGTQRFLHATYGADQRVADRGVKLDLPMIDRLIDLADAARERASPIVHRLTDGAVESVSQVAALVEWVQAQGVPLQDMQADSVRKALKGEFGTLPPKVRKVLELRKEIARSSTAKYVKMKGAACRDGRLRGLYEMYGAERTGRWAGRLVQTQNLTRPKQARSEIDYGLNLLAHDAADLLDVPPMQMAADSLRAMFVASKGQLAVGDWSAIEGRMLALLAGERDKIAMYERFDAGDGPDAYEDAYAGVFGGDPKDVTASQRKIGKVIDLAFGYGGGVGGEVKFCATYGVDVASMASNARENLPAELLEQSEEQHPWFVARKMDSGLDKELWVPLNAVKIAYRNRYARIASLWPRCEEAFRHVRNVPGDSVQVVWPVPGLLASGVTMSSRRINGKVWVFIQLPSGRSLVYPNVVEQEVKRRTVDETGEVGYDLVSELRYFGKVPNKSHKWGPCVTHGGVLVENITQAACADLLAEAICEADRQSLNIIMHCHDEMVDDMDETGSAQRLADVMEQPVAWAPWPSLKKAVVHTSTRYGKF